MWIGLLAAGTSRPVYAQRFTFEALGGSAYNIPTPLTIQQNGYPDLRFTAHYDTKPFGPYWPYYSWRGSMWNEARDAAWEISQVHHRIFLSNNPPEVQAFAVHFGYNFYMFGRALKRAGFIYHVDGGVLICNPESTVRDQTLHTLGTGIFGQGYTLAGVGGQVAVSRTFDLTRRIFLSGNMSLMAGRARVPIADGTATVPNLSLHGQIGAGYRF